MLVIPAKAGIQRLKQLPGHWIPAFAGMTACKATLLESFSAGMTARKAMLLECLLLVIPAKAGIQRLQAVAEALDPGFRRDDGVQGDAARVLFCSSFQRKLESSGFKQLPGHWIPAFAGMTARKATLLESFFAGMAACKATLLKYRRRRHLIISDSIR